MGVLAAVIHARETGRGQVVDAAMVDGAASLVGLIYGLRGLGLWSEGRQDNLLDGGTPWYATYACADGKFIALAPLEPQFWAAFLARAGLDDPVFQHRDDRTVWPELRAKLTAFFASQDRDHWAALFEDVDACVSPVLSFDEAPSHPHNRARGTFTGEGRGAEVAAAPRFSLTPGAIKGPPPASDAHRDAVLSDWGVDG
jgi:alpha-methylacyl-CoA racemase